MSWWANFKTAIKEVFGTKPETVAGTPVGGVPSLQVIGLGLVGIAGTTALAIFAHRGNWFGLRDGLKRISDRTGEWWAGKKKPSGPLPEKPPQQAAAPAGEKPAGQALDIEPQPSGQRSPIDIPAPGGHSKPGGIPAIQLPVKTVEEFKSVLDSRLDPLNPHRLTSEAMQFIDASLDHPDKVIRAEAVEEFFKRVRNADYEWAQKLFYDDEPHYQTAWEFYDKLDPNKILRGSQTLPALASYRKDVPVGILDKILKRSKSRLTQETIDQALLESRGVDKIERLLEEGADIEAKNDNDETILLRMVSVQKDNPEALRFLLGKNANPNVTNEDGDGLIHLASSFGYTQKVKAILDAHPGLDLNPRNKAGMTPLLQAENMEMVNLLLHHGADKNAIGNAGETLLYKVAGFSTPNDLEKLLSEGIALSRTNEAGETALSAAVKNGNTENAKFLLGKGIPYTGVDVLNALESMDGEILKAFNLSPAQLQEKLSTVASSRQAKTMWRTVVTKALEESDPTRKAEKLAFIKTVISPNKASFDGINGYIRDEGGDDFNLLHSAIAKKDEEVVGVLLENGINLNSPKIETYSSSRGYIYPIFMASGLDDPGISRRLIAHGVDCNVDSAISNGAGTETPLHRAIQANNLIMAQVLLKSPGIDPNRGIMKIFDGNMEFASPLYTAIEKRQEDIAIGLIKAGADRNRGRSQCKFTDWEKSYQDGKKIETIDALLGRLLKEDPANRGFYQKILTQLDASK